MNKLSLLLVLLLSMVMCSNIPEGQKVLIETSYGDVKVVLYDDTPLHRDNFLKLIKENYYDDLIFHRVIKGFMIQGGESSVKKDSVLDESKLIPAEINPSKHIHKAGALAAARWGNVENPKKMSDAYQFYIVSGSPVLDMDYDKLTNERTETLKLDILGGIIADAKMTDSLRTVFYSEEGLDWNTLGADVLTKVDQELEARKSEIYQYTQEQKDIYKEIGGAPFLDTEYTVFGEVYEGMDVVKKIEKVKTNVFDKPLEPVVIKSVKLIE